MRVRETSAWIIAVLSTTWNLWTFVRMGSSVEATQPRNVLARVDHRV